MRPKPMAGYGRGETPIPGRVDPGGDPSSLLERDYRMYTPELVVVSDRREGGGRSAGEKAEKADREEVDADAPSAGVGSGSAPRVSVSASSDSSTAEKENELAEELARVGVGPGLDPEKTKLAADRVADLDLVYDPILNFTTTRKTASTTSWRDDGKVHRVRRDRAGGASRRARDRQARRAL